MAAQAHMWRQPLTPRHQGVNATGWMWVEFTEHELVCLCNPDPRSSWPEPLKGRIHTMNAKLAIPSLAVLMATQGCIIVGGGGGGRDDGDVTFSWTFYGQTCSQSGVSNVRVTIPGESLENSGFYPCVS